MKTSSKKAKGRNLQYWVCNKIADIFDIEYDQQDDNCLIHSRPSGLNGCDIILTGELYKKFPFDIECKNQEKLSLYPTIKQAKKNTKEDRDWLVVHKKNYSEPIVIMDWKTFEKIIKIIR